MLSRLVGGAFLGVVLFSSCEGGITPPPPGGKPALPPEVIWKVPSSPLSNDHPHSPGANQAKTSIYYATTDYRLKKIRASDGEVLWDVGIGPEWETLPRWNVAVSGSVAVVTKVDLFAFDTTTGVQRWTYVAPDFDETGRWPIVADDSTVYAASLEGRAYAIDSRTGTARWIKDLTEGDPTVGALNPLLGGGTLYLCTKSFSQTRHSRLWALDTRNGNVKWSESFTSDGMPGGCTMAPALSRDLVIAPHDDGRIIAFDTVAGTVRWTAPRVHDESHGQLDRREVAATDEGIFVTSGTGKHVYLDPATGAQRWQNTDKVPFAPQGLPNVDAELAVLDYGHTFVALELATGRMKWSLPATVYDPATPYKGRAILASDRIFVGGRDGSYAIRR